VTRLLLNAYSASRDRGQCSESRGWGRR
jgi:hypothetical protein